MFRMMPRLRASAASGTRATAIGGFFLVSAACPRPFLAVVTSECGSCRNLSRQKFQRWFILTIHAKTTGKQTVVMTVVCSFGGKPIIVQSHRL